jgi:hypothetical protein
MSNSTDGGGDEDDLKKSSTEAWQAKVLFFSIRISS